MFHTTADWSEPAEASGYVVLDFAGWRASPDGLTSEERDLFSFRCFGFTRTDRLVRWAGPYCTFGGGPPLHPVLKAKILERIVDRAPG
ncbi:MAG: hypothetical protein K0S81_1226 [Rhodospirillales bacterium]|jgi:hypothetical protein|nr:hypothetical protein [Rhodospirillales bacterium]